MSEADPMFTFTVTVTVDSDSGLFVALAERVDASEGGVDVVRIYPGIADSMIGATIDAVTEMMNPAPPQQRHC